MIVYLFPRWTGNILIWSAHTNRLTIHIQAVVSNPLLPAQCRVDGLAAQRCPIVFPFNWNLDGAGHTEGLPVFLLGYHTWRETERDEMMEGMRTRWGVGGGQETTNHAKHSCSSFYFSCRDFGFHHPVVEEGRRRGREGDGQRKETLKEMTEVDR